MEELPEMNISKTDRFLNLLLVAFLVTSCSAMKSSPTPIPVPPAIQTPTILPAADPSTTPAERPTQSQSDPGAAQATLPPTLSSIITFPASPGTTWVYFKKGYTQADGEPQKIVHGTSKIVETIVEEKEVLPYFLVHIKGNKTMVSADDGWQENDPFGLGDYEYWYIFKDNLIYYSFTKPDLLKSRWMRCAWIFNSRLSGFGVVYHHIASRQCRASYTGPKFSL